MDEIEIGIQNANQLTEGIFQIDRSTISVSACPIIASIVVPSVTSIGKELSKTIGPPPVQAYF